MRFESVINRYSFEANYSGRINIEGDGLQYRSFISISQLTQVMSGLLSGTLQPGTFNVTVHNEQILAIAQMIKDVFPKLEMIFVDQQFDHKGIHATPNPRIIELIKDSDRSLESEIHELCRAFAFSGTNPDALNA
jgi:UDP-glucose 4-epimerase